MRSSSGNQKVVVLLGGKPIDVLVGVELNCALLRLQQVGHHLLAIDVLLRAEINTPSLPRIQHVVTLILGIVDQIGIELCPLALAASRPSSARDRCSPSCRDKHTLPPPHPACSNSHPGYS